MKVIFGAGLIGLIAREILGGDWTVIPQGSSRFFKTVPPLSDFHISISDRVSDVLPVTTANPITFTRAYSYGGELLYGNNIWGDLYTQKLYGEPDFRKSLIKIEEVVSRTSAVELFQTLSGKYQNEILSNHEKFGRIVGISGDMITTDTSQLTFTKAVSTIPLDALFKFMGVNHDLQARDVYIYHVQCAYDLENADQVLVVDEYIDFYKVNVIDPKNLVFFSFNEIKTPDEYFSVFMGECIIANHTCVPNAFPLGSPPNLDWLRNTHNIHPVGSCAEWDDFVDISSSILRLLKIS